MKRDWNKPNIRDAYKPVPQAFDQAVSATIQSLQREDENNQKRTFYFFGMTRRMAVLAVLCVLLVGMTVAYAITRPAILNWLLGYGNANPFLEQSAQNITAENSADHITARINGVVYDGYQFAFSYELENDQPDQPAMVVLDGSVLVNGQTLGLNASMYDPKIVPDTRQDILPVRRNPTDGGAWSLPIRKDLSGNVTCEVTFMIYRPIKGFVVVSDPEDDIYHLDAYDADEQAEILDSWNTLRSFKNTIIADRTDNDMERWSRDDYTVIDSNGGAYMSERDVGKEWGDANLFNLRETARIPVTFTFNTDMAIVYDFSDAKDIELSDCTVHIHRLRFSPLTTIVDISLIPKENSKAAAQELAKRYGPIDLLDENGAPLIYADMDYEFSPNPWATEQWKDNGGWACTYSIEMPGLDAWPESIGIITDQGELLRVNLEKRMEWENEKEQMNTWSLEDKAAFSEDVKGEIWQEPRYILPQEDQITKEQAKQIAISAMAEKYGISDDDMLLWKYQESLEYYDADFPEDGSFYNFTWINNTSTAVHQGGDVYVVHIDPDTGEIILIESNDDMVG